MHCAQCGTLAVEGSRFCSNCGAPLVAPRPTEGERKLVTVLFADVVGSTAMAEKLDPEQIGEMMAGAFGFMNAAVARYGGTVSRLMGDAILALFGAPVAHEDDPERAVRAALDIRDAAERYKHTVRQVYGVDFQVRVGIHTGLAVLATVGDAIRAEYTAMGDTPNVAARVQSAAQPGTVLVTASTLRHVRDLVEYTDHEPIQAKGKSQALEVYVVDAIQERGHARGVAGLRSPLVGRDAEMALLRSLVGGLAEGRGAIAVVSAEAGLGKSRLVAELAAGRPRGVTWLEGRAFSYGQSMVHAVWRDLFRTDIGSTAAESPTAVRAHLHTRTRALGLSASDVAAIETVLGVQSPESTAIVSALDDQTFEPFVVGALKRFVAADARPSGCIVVFDDIHWADAGSLAYIEAIADLSETAPVLVLATLRPERASAGFQTAERLKERFGTRLHALELEPLDDRASEALLDHLLDVRDMPASIRATILARSDGNPFFVEEVLRSFIDSGHIFLDDRVWRAHPDIVDVTIPETLTGVLTARLDRLPERARRVIQTASVIGRTFPYPVLASVCDSADGAERIQDPTPQMQTLTEEGLVQERTREPDLDYIFKHALTQEAAYELLLLRRRRDLHRRTGLAMEAFYAERTDELAPVLARHFFEGDEWRRAARYAAEGALQALEVYHGAEALELRDLACKANDRDPDAPVLETCDAILSWAEIAFKVRTREEILGRLERAEKIARDAGDDLRLAHTLNWIGNAHIMAGFPGDGMPPLLEAFDLARKLDDERLLLLPLFLTTVMIVDEDPAGALVKLDEVIDAARKFKNRDVEAHTLGAKANALARLGRFAEARVAIDEALRLAALTQSPIKLADVNSMAGMVFLTLGDPVRAAAHGRAAAEMAGSVKGQDCQMYGHMVHGLGEMKSGKYADARTAFQKATELVRRRGRSHYAYRIEGLSEILRYRDGGGTDAKTRVLQAIEDAKQADDPYAAALFADELARADIDAGQLAAAGPGLETAIAYYAAKGMLPAWLEALQALAKVREAEGNADAITQLRDEIAQLSTRIQPAPPELRP